MPNMYFPKEEYEDRWRRVHENMKRKGYETALVWGRSAGSFDRAGDVLYLTNFYSGHSGHEYDTPVWQARSYAAVILQQGETPALHMEDELFPRDMLPTDRVEWHMDPVQGVIDALKRRRISGKVALVGSDTLPMKYGRRLEEALPKIEWEWDDRLVLEVRRKKSAREIVCLREAGEIATRGMTKLMEGLVAGKTEAEACAEAVAEVMKRGGVCEYIRCSHGDRVEHWSRAPISGYSTDPVKEGDIVRAWLMGPMKEGYFMDPGRTAVCGNKPTKEQRALIEDCARIVEGIIEAMKPGVRVSDLARVGDRLQQKVGGADQVTVTQWPLYGHRMGLFWDSWIGPDITDEDDVFEAETVCSSETFLIRKGVGFAGFEQNLIVTESGAEILTKTPMLWW